MASPGSNSKAHKLIQKISPKHSDKTRKGQAPTVQHATGHRGAGGGVQAAVASGYSAVVAIDFGTTYSGYAFAFTRDQQSSNIHIMDPRALGTTAASHGTQQPTVLLLTADQEFHSFGYEAQEFYRDIDEKECLNWLYFEKFKMELHSRETLHEGMELIAANGQTVTALTVFAHALCHFKHLSLNELNDLSTEHITGDSVQWVITVPAIWRPSARQFMRRAAVEAGLVSESDPKQLILALEPEAASIYCRQLQLRDCIQTYSDPLSLSSSSALAQRHSLSSSSSSSPSSSSPGSPGHPSASYSPCLSTTSSSSDNIMSSTGQRRNTAPAASLSPGVSYVVADCGGGTIDLTVHQIEEDGQLKELCKSTGGAWGSIGVDCQFEMMLVSIFGEHIIQEFIDRHPVSWLELMKTFEAKKRAFNPLRHQASNISLPFAFIQHYTHRTHRSVERAILAYNKSDVQWSSQGMLRLLTPAMNRLFDPVVNTIVKHILRILSHSNLTHIQYLFLVGGFAESPVLQNAMKDAFEPSIKVIIPHDMSLCILKGAVLFGLDPTVVNIRRSVLTYGVACLHKFDPSVHPPDKRVIKDGVEWCTEIFDMFVSAGQGIPQGYSITRCYKLARSSLQSTVLTLFASPHKKVKFVTDPGVKKIGELRLELPPLADDKQQSTREVQMSMSFGDTEISVKGLDSNSRQTAFAQIDFLCRK